MVAVVSRVAARFWGNGAHGCLTCGAFVMRKKLERIRLGAVLVAALGLSACLPAGVTLEPEEVQELKIVRVDVNYPAKARISWPRANKEYKRLGNAPSAEVSAFTETSDTADTNAPTGPRSNLTPAEAQRAYIRDRLTRRLTERTLEVFADRPNGTREVAVKMDVESFHIQTAAERILVGGTHLMHLKVSLVDLQSGEQITQQQHLGIAGESSPDAVASAIGDKLAKKPIDQLMDRLDSHLRLWIFPKEERLRLATEKANKTSAGR